MTIEQYQLASVYKNAIRRYYEDNRINRIMSFNEYKKVIDRMHAGETK